MNLRQQKHLYIFLRISEDIKKLLNSLLHKTLHKRLKRLENRHLEQKKWVELTGKSFELYKSHLESLKKNMEETLKKKNEETQRRLKVNSRKNLISKSVTPNKRSRISRKENNHGKKILEEKNLNLTKNKTENNIKKNHNMCQSLRDKRALSEINLIKKNKKIKKIDISSFITNKDGKKKYLKSKTMINFNIKKKWRKKKYK